MTTPVDDIVIAFSGSKKAQALASSAFNTLRARGAFMSDDAVIRVPLAALAEYLGTTEKTLTEAVSDNSDVFGMETDAEGMVSVTTTRTGHAPVQIQIENLHTLQARLMTPEPKPAPRPRPVREVLRTNQAWANYISEFSSELEEEEEESFAQALVEAPEVATPEIVEAVEEAVQPDIVAEPVADAEAEIIEEVLEAEVEAIAEELEIVAEAEIEPEPVVPARPEIPVFEEVVSAPTPTRSLGEPTDVSGFADEEIVGALERQFAHHAHVAFFGGRWMTTDRAHRLSRGNIRDIRQYIEEQEQPLTDEVIVEDVLRVRPGNPEYANTVFALNYWLSKERDFEFVGTSDQRFWSITELPALGTTLRKPNDIGSDYRFLTDDFDQDTVAYRSVDSVDHIVSFYEWNLGLLPYDEDLQKLFPAPMLADQRSAVFTFEIPQLYTTYWVELRYPTPTRGGFLLGLDDLYFDSLVPGAIISISATENDGHYTIEFIEAGEQSARLLEVEEKRPRYHFRDTTFSCGVDDAWLLSEDRFSNLAGVKPLGDRDRRKLATVVETTFERVGMDDGNGGYLASFDDLLAAINIERPVSAEMLRGEIALHDSMSGDDANGYTYVAG